MFVDVLSKPPSGPETGFQGTALMGGGGGGSASSARRPSPPLPAASSGAIDVEAEIAAGMAQGLLVAGGGDGGDEGGGAGELSGAFVECPRCTTRNSLAATRCTACENAF